MSLFVVSHYCGDLDNFLKVAKNYAQRAEEEDNFSDIDQQLKNFLNTKKLEYSTGFISIKKVLEDFRNSCESPEDWINSKWLGRALLRLDFVGQKRLVNGSTQIKFKWDITQTLQTQHSLYTLQNSTNSTKINKKGVELVEFKDFVDKDRDVEKPLTALDDSEVTL